MRLSTLVAAVALFGAACGHPQQKPTDPVAQVGKDVITVADLDKEVGSQLSQMEEQHQQQVYQVKKQAVDKLVQEKLFGQKAKEAGVATADEFLQKKFTEMMAKVPDPSDAELQAEYDKAKAGGQQLPPFDQIKPRIVDYLKQQKIQPQMMAYYEGVKKEANVKILLPPYLPAKKDVEAKGPSMMLASDGQRKAPAGEKDAPITIVEFSDFQCPFCVKAEPTVKQLMAAYPGKIRLIYRDFPLEFHKLAPKAAEASHCAEDQGKYWEMHEKLFAANGALEVDNLKKIARDVGLDGGKFDQCLDSGVKKTVVDENFAAGKKVGVTGTPAFFINGRLLSGALPLEEFKTVIDAELAAK